MRGEGSFPSRDDELPFRQVSGAMPDTTGLRFPKPLKKTPKTNIDHMSTSLELGL